MAKVLFYHWDYKEQARVSVIQRAINAIFDGVHAPFITDDIPVVDWDRLTIAICSEPISSETLGKLLKENDEALNDWWYYEKDVPQPFEVL